jgi:hypothetical protein
MAKHRTHHFKFFPTESAQENSWIVSFSTLIAFHFKSPSDFYHHRNDELSLYEYLVFYKGGGRM